MNFNIDITFDIFLLVAAILAYQFAKYQILFQKKSEVYAELYEKWFDYVVNTANLTSKDSGIKIKKTYNKSIEAITAFYILYKRSSLFLSEELQEIFETEVELFMKINDAYKEILETIPLEIKDISKNKKAQKILKKIEQTTIEKIHPIVYMDGKLSKEDNPIISQMRKELNNNLVNDLLEKIKSCKKPK